MPLSLARSAAALLLCTALAAPALAAQPDPFFPEFGNTGFEVLDYDIAIDASALPRIRAEASLAIVVRQQLGSLSLDLRDALAVSRVTVDGTRATFTQAGDKLTVTPRQPLADGARATVRIVYAGTPDPLPDPTYPNPQGELPLGWLTAPDGGVYVVSEPVGASSWYPANDVPTDKATFSFAITVAEPLTAAASGLPLGVVDNGDTRTFRFRVAQPMTSWQATLHINDYVEVESLQFNKIPIRNYITENVNRTERAALSRTPQYMRFLTKQVGVYPYDSYGNAIVEDPDLYYALETGTLSTYPSDFINEEVLVHELTHQYFGNAVAIRRWEDIWIAEGFATYFETLWTYRDDPTAFDEAMRSLHAFLVANEIPAPVISSPFDLFATTVYYRGGVALYALRLKVGDAVFDDIVQTFYGLYRNKNVSTQQFIDLAVEISGDGSVRPFLRDWLLEDPVPELDGAARAAKVSQAERAAVGEAIVRTSKSVHRPHLSVR